MNKKMSRLKIRRPNFVRRGFNLPAIVRIFVLAGFVTVGGIGIVQQVDAAQSASDYCGQYTDLDQKNACKDGLNGTDCSDYAIFADQATVDICTKAARDLAAGVVTQGNVTVTPTPSPSPTPSETPSGFDDAELQNLLDQADTLSQYIDILHQAGPDSETDTSGEADNNYGSYVNGAGKQQPIKVDPSGQPNSPAILFFNGGGWHVNDHVSDKVAPDAKARGYTVMDVTYRLGSSGIYYMFEDVMRGVQHVRNNAAMYNIDPNKIAVWGDSAGGSLSMRVAASGRSGAKAAVGWSAPTNAYTAVFKSFQSFAIGLDHSTCAPTDLAGFANFADLATGGSGNVAEYGQGLSSNDVSALGINLDGSTTALDPLALLTQSLIAGQNALSAGRDIESISSQIGSGDPSSLFGSAFNLASSKIPECIDNFNVASPALFASPDSSPSFLAGFETDGLIDPSQLTGMRDKLRQLGIHSDSLILPESEECLAEAPASAGAGGCHLGYFKPFVCPSLNFLDSEIQPERGNTDCATGVAENQGNNDAGGGGGPGGGGEGGEGGESTDGNSCTYIYNKDGKATSYTGACDSNREATAEQSCKNGGGTYIADRRGTGQSGCNISSPQQAAPTYNCLNGNDKLDGKQCTYNAYGNSCYGDSRKISADAAGNATCAYGALENYTRKTNVSQPNCSNAGGVFANPGAIAGGFSGDCWTKK